MSARRTGGCWLLLVLCAWSSACGTREIRRFPLAPPIWNDDDRRPLAEQPDEYFSGLAWDAVDQTLFLPIEHFLLAERTIAAQNVNAYDEVPNSSWFQNRIGVRAMSPEELRRGACPDDLLEEDETIVVTAAKPNGANPGFIIEDDAGRGWLVKFDGRNFSDERATTADVLGSRLYHAAGYHAPCNIVFYLNPADLEIGEDATTEDAFGRETPLTEADVQAITDVAITREDGYLRASASLFVDGVPLGPWKYQSTRKDDPNDVIPHQDRRELRGARLLAAWINHFDAREQNTLATFVTDERGNSWVKHWYIDFGDALGSRWEQDGLSRRFGYSYYFDATDVLVDFVTLGMVSRPWLDVEVSDVAPLWGYFDVEHFDAPRWKPGYPNQAFNREQPADGAWMARIIARFDEAAIRATVAEGRLSDPDDEEELVRILLGRRARILDHYLTVVSPLADFEVQSDGETLCFTDLAANTGTLDARVLRYQSRFYVGDRSEPLWSRDVGTVRRGDNGRRCLSLVHEEFRRPSAGSSDGYAVLDVEIVPVPGADPIPPARLHFYDTPERGFVLVGIERPERAAPRRRR